MDSTDVNAQSTPYESPSINIKLCLQITFDWTEVTF